MNTLDGNVGMVETISNTLEFGATVAVAICCCLIIFAGVANKQTNGSTAKSHWIHQRNVPRFGGVTIILGLIALVLMTRTTSNGIAHALLLSSSPLVLTGLIEDIGTEIKPSLRIIAGFASGFSAVFLTDAWITEIEVPYFDLLLAIPFIAIPLSAFASTTLAHSFNLIDGLNGLCSGLSILAFMFFGALAFISGDTEILSFTMLITSCVLGFWLLNVATGRIFLGDAGAYFLGHTAAWTAVVLAARYPIISPWALFLGLIYPISETLITIGRRRLAGTPVSAPDKKHLHHLLYQWILNGSGLSERVANGTSGSIIVIWSAVPAAIALFNFSFSITCFVVAAVYFLANIRAYVSLQRVLGPPN